jgi:hypothetical protein
VFVRLFNDIGAVGDGTASMIIQPLELSSRSIFSGKKVAFIDVGIYNAFAITSDDIIYGWVK